MKQQNLAIRIVGYVEKSTRPTRVAPAYDRLIRNTIFGIKPCSSRVHDHVTGLINSAQHRARCGDSHNCKLMIDNAIDIMRVKNYHDMVHDHGDRIFHEIL